MVLRGRRNHERLELGIDFGAKDHIFLGRYGECDLFWVQAESMPLCTVLAKTFVPAGSSAISQLIFFGSLFDGALFDASRNGVIINACTLKQRDQRSVSIF